MNQINLIGRIGGEVVTKDQGGKSVTNFSIAVNEIIKDEHGTKTERTQWFRCALWQRANMAKYLKSGGRVYISGTLKIPVTTYKNKNGEYMPDLQINVDAIEPIDWPEKDAAK